MSETGNEYDNNPPPDTVGEAFPPRTRGPAPFKFDACKEWLTNLLAAQPVTVKDIRLAAQAQRYSPSTLYKLANKLQIVEYLLDGRKYWRLPDSSSGEDRAV